MDTKTNYFGTFLASGSTAVVPSAAPQVANVASAVPDANSDPLNLVLKELEHGDRPMRNLLALTGKSLTAFIAVRDQLLGLGLVEQTAEGSLRLTSKGHDIVAALA